MSSKDKNYQRPRIEADQEYSRAGYNEFIDPLKKRSQDITKQGVDERANVLGRANAMNDTGGLSEDDIAAVRGAYGSMGGAIPDYTEERNYYRNFADTGGYTDKDTQRIRAQAATSAPSLYEALNQQQQTAQARMGGANAGTAAGLNAKSIRATAQQAASDKLAANIGLTESQRDFKLKGVQGLESTKTSEGELRSRAASFASQGEQAILNARASGKERGLAALQGMYGTSYQPEVDDRNWWLKALGQRGGENVDYHGLSLTNDKTDADKKGSLAGLAAGGLGALKDIKWPKWLGGSGGGGGDNNNPNRDNTDLYAGLRPKDEDSKEFVEHCRNTPGDMDPRCVSIRDADITFCRANPDHPACKGR